jgi:hypothetical protein
MSDSKKTNARQKATEQEIRQGRKFDLAEAVGRQAAGALKGASPVAGTKQLLLEAEHLLDLHLYDPEGSLLQTIVANLAANPPLLAQHLDDAPGLLRTHLQGTLDSPTDLDLLVRQTDARWGRDYQERPHFNSPDQEPHPDDPYTPEQVRRELELFLTHLQ